jgi:hypothetical protein
LVIPLIYIIRLKSRGCTSNNARIAEARTGHVGLIDASGSGAEMKKPFQGGKVVGIFDF